MNINRSKLLSIHPYEIFFYFFALAPLIGYITITYLNVDYYNFMAAGNYLMLFLLLIDKRFKLKIPKYVIFLSLFAIYIFFLL